MKTLFLLIFLLRSGFASLAQAPQPAVVQSCQRADVIVSSAVWTEATKTLKVVIRNIGHTAASPFLVYADAEISTNPPLNPLCQTTAEIPSLPAGASLTRSFNFNNASCRTTGALAGANRFRITADAKDAVCECSEFNNVRIKAR